MSFEDMDVTPLEAMELVTSKNGLGVYASADVLFTGAVFGRDSIETAEDMIDVKPELVENVLTTLISLQGQQEKILNEEEFGKIVHEYRAASVDGIPVEGVSKQIFEELSKRWGGDDQGMRYYGSVDATPHFMRLFGAYCDKYGSGILEKTIPRHDGSITTGREAFEQALGWVERKLDNSESGLLEYQRKHKDGIENQVWKDSKEFYVHRDGQLVNHNNPVASIEVQGLVFDALLTASKVIPEREQELLERAIKLRSRTIELLWMPLEKYFALGTDIDETGKLRVITTRTANPAALLDTHMFDGPGNKKYVRAIISTIFSPDFLTNAGIRSRALSESGLIPFWDYHGSYVTWPKETGDIAKGARRQGFARLADQLENRLLNVISQAESYPEFIFVDRNGKVIIGEAVALDDSEMLLIDSTNHPENIQAWTVAAVIRILSQNGNAKNHFKGTNWHKHVESQILISIPFIPPLTEKAQRDLHYPFIPHKIVRDKSATAGFAVHNALDIPA